MQKLWSVQDWLISLVRTLRYECVRVGRLERCDRYNRKFQLFFFFFFYTVTLVDSQVFSNFFEVFTQNNRKDHSRINYMGCYGRIQEISKKNRESQHFGNPTKQLQNE